MFIDMYNILDTDPRFMFDYFVLTVVNFYHACPIVLSKNSISFILFTIFCFIVIHCKFNVRHIVYTASSGCH